MLFRDVSFLLVLSALGSCSPATNGSDAATEAGDAPVDAVTRDPVLARLDSYLRGDFDNRAQVAGGFTKRVERHVCPIPNRVDDPAVLWLYVEHVEVLPDGRRDAYFTRVNEIRMVNGRPVSRASRFVAGHPLASNAFQFNGPRDGCTMPDVLSTIRDTDLEYRAGCDVTFTPETDRFDAATMGTGCTFPGGYINTQATVTMNGIDSTDLAVSNGQSIGDTYQFRRVP